MARVNSGSEVNCRKIPCFDQDLCSTHVSAVFHMGMHPAIEQQLSDIKAQIGLPVYAAEMRKLTDRNC